MTTAEGDAPLAHAAARVLFANWTGGYTVPSRSLYPHQWSWDSAFIAIGLRHLSPRRAQRELESLFGAQWADGRVPHIVFDPATPSDAYFPGPEFWRHSTAAAATTGLVQPPVHAIAAWETYRAAPDEARRRGFLPRMYPRLVAWHAYLTRCRTPSTGGGLVAIVHPWESGMDNSPSWDAPLARVEPVPAGTVQRRDLQHAPAADRPTDTDYGRYVRLAADYRDLGYVDKLDALDFVILDPMTNALLAAAEGALAEIAAEMGADPAPHRARSAEITDALLTGLYDADEGLAFPRDVRTGEPIHHRTVAGLMPLLLPGIPDAVLQTVLQTGLGASFELGRTALVPSYDLTGPAFEPGRYWRGPGWFNTSWLLWRGLVDRGQTGVAARLRERMLDTARRCGFREYVHPITGEGHGVGDFSWTAALTLDLLHRRT